jgi:hypothetical protein
VTTTWVTSATVTTATTWVTNSTSN